MHSSIREFFTAVAAMTVYVNATLADCYCERDLPLFAEDPLVTMNSGLISYVRPDMVSVNEAGECFVDNQEGFFEGVAEEAFFFGSEEYARVQIFTNDDYSRWSWSNMVELNSWALHQCEQLILIS